VGIAGHALGGGHAPLSTAYGLGADQILQMNVVLPNGSMITVNGCQNTDLYYAMRGEKLV